ncbi:hypothetical protein llap_11363 [Limosa lapponica baueri]|uniref:Uncharacterized protein n=1 Tax=Limosa lapponica baueri TaxID=1758121 RepID=A0A2I0TWY6_LIMLA|nr:hypothetical protein llap_11363 [Limosa lapponica baueri]
MLESPKKQPAVWRLQHMIQEDFSLTREESTCCTKSKVDMSNEAGEGNQLEGECFNPVRQLIVAAQDHVKPSECSERGQGDFLSKASILTWPAKLDASPEKLQTDSAAKSGNSLCDHISETEVSNPRRNKVMADQKFRSHRRKRVFCYNNAEQPTFFTPEAPFPRELLTLCAGH